MFVLLKVGNTQLLVYCVQYNAVATLSAIYNIISIKHQFFDIKYIQKLATNIKKNRKISIKVKTQYL
jgi:hypothetical protein